MVVNSSIFLCSYGELEASNPKMFFSYSQPHGLCSNIHRAPNPNKAKGPSARTLGIRISGCRRWHKLSP